MVMAEVSWFYNKQSVPNLNEIISEIIVKIDDCMNHFRGNKKVDECMNHFRGNIESRWMNGAFQR